MVREGDMWCEGWIGGEGARRCEGRIVVEMAVRCESWWIVTIIAGIWRGLLGPGEDKEVEETPTEQDLTLDIYLIICGPSRNIKKHQDHQHLL